MHVVAHHAHAPGPPVVLVHGAPDRSKNFAKVVHLLSDMAVTAYDRRGFGKSLHVDPPSAGFDTAVEDLLSVLDGRPSVVCGQSVGGTIAMMAAIQAPELFLALGVWESPVPWETFWPRDNQEKWLPLWLSHAPRDLGEQFNRSLIGEDRWNQLPERTRELLRAEGASFHADLASQVQAPFHVADVKCPMVVGAGTDTEEWLLDAYRELARVTHAEYFVTEGANHVAHTHFPEVWAELVRRTVALLD
jgi:pimeloyl-ACP methyl ester carboxylesterase